MKYTDLKTNLKQKIEKNYLIFGEDRFLCYDALKKIEEAININLKDMNMAVISAEKISAKDIVDSANLYPFGDEYRLVVVKNYELPKSKEEIKILQDYLNNPLESTILVFFNPDIDDDFKSMSNLTVVDCNKIDIKFIYAYAKNILTKAGCQFEDSAIEKLIIFCNSDMTRINNELEKLQAYISNDKVLTEGIIEEFVVQDKEYQVFQLAEFLAKGDAKNAIDLVDSFSYKSGFAYLIMNPLFNNYRRALFISLNKDKNISELANLLSVKEYAIRAMQNQIKTFSPKKIKRIISLITEYDNKIKIGEMKEKTAIKMLVFNILNIRGQND